MKRILFLIALTMAVSGCESGFQMDEAESVPVYPELTICTEESWMIRPFNYAIDENTGIVYIMSSYSGVTGITVAYKSDGTVMKKEDYEKLLEERRKDDEKN